MSRTTVDVQGFIDRHPVSRFQLRILVLCFLVAALDGLDTAVGGFIAPVLREEWSLTAAQLNPLLGAVLLGLMCGAFAAGPLADRFGRKRVLLVSVLIFAGVSVVSATANDVQALTVLRFVIGLGLGGALPNAVTLTSEYCPARHRSLMVTVMFCGFTLGSALGGVLVAHWLPMIGWRGVLLVSGLLPLSCLPLLLLLLPESVRFLIARRNEPEHMRRILRRIAPLPEDATFHLGTDQAKGSPVGQILSGRLRLGTWMLWGSFFSGFVIIYMMTNWLPTLIKDSGWSLSQAALGSAMFQVGGTLGAVVLGAAMDRLDAWRVLTVAYVGGALMMLVVSQWYTYFPVLVLCITAIGFCISGGQVGANALAAGFYPTTSRATGIAWCHGVGRVGSIGGTLAGGMLLEVGLGLSGIFIWLTLPALLAAASALVMGRRYRSATRLGGVRNAAL